MVEHSEFALHVLIVEVLFVHVEYENDNDGDGNGETLKRKSNHMAYDNRQTKEGTEPIQGVSEIKLPT